MSATTTPDPEGPTSDLPAAAPVRWERYIAMGDSFSEGLWDPYPDAPEVQRGWADNLAAVLSTRRIAAGQAPLEYANLAIRGRKLRPIIAEQLDITIEAQPDLVSLVGGGNDILRASADIDAISAALEDAVVALRATGADVLMGTGFKGGAALSWTNGRVGVFNANLWSIADRHGAHVLDLWGMRALADLRLWSEDRIHLTPEGHQRVANAALVALGLEPDDAAYDAPLDAAPPAAFRETARANAAWMRQHVGPWVKRRLTGTSSGDGRTAKWPTPQPWPRA
ncbi:lysophospholipase L1-like esterase [Promicromonospora iranensis]|uniref:Lysophospholipase L1-like esterase n=1 Tax=Promicromonospora iranensis TaxID=1105144 RepID=A0ABU2CR14_9MICO|nr:lysophospholipase L1-like esterase [Promicromonospora iranensis]